jgi:hypothetical protein
LVGFDYRYYRRVGADVGKTRSLVIFQREVF